ncbi:MAG TPA: hypothetical protein VMT05_10245 [Terriglobales bacterium]|nr:hypothetical protein [Terriglobales bacterium]
MRTRIPMVLLAIALVSMAVMAQTGGLVAAPARSQDESVSLGYMRTVVNAQKNYKKKYGQYATSLAALVHSGSFTRRMANTDRGVYTVQFHGKPEAYSLVLAPKQFDPDHRAFYVDETGKIRVEEDRAATAESPLLK